MKKANILSIAALSLLLPMRAFAGTSSGGTNGGTEQQGEQTSADFTAEERTALLVINMNNIMEIKGCLIAFEKVTSPEVRDLAWKVIHSRVVAEGKLIAFAKEYKFELVSTEPALVASQTEGEALLTTLEGTPDAEFANVFLSTMKTKHEALLTQLQGWEPTVQQKEIKAILKQTISDIKAHDMLAAGIGMTPTQPVQPVQ